MKNTEVFTLLEKASRPYYDIKWYYNNKYTNNNIWKRYRLRNISSNNQCVDEVFQISMNLPELIENIYTSMILGRSREIKFDWDDKLKPYNKKIKSKIGSLIKKQSSVWLTFTYTSFTDWKLKISEIPFDNLQLPEFDNLKFWETLQDINEYKIISKYMKDNIIYTDEIYIYNDALRNQKKTTKADDTIIFESEIIQTKNCPIAILENIKYTHINNKESIIPINDYHDIMWIIESVDNSITDIRLELAKHGGSKIILPTGYVSTVTQNYKDENGVIQNTSTKQYLKDTDFFVVDKDDTKPEYMNKPVDYLKEMQVSVDKQLQRIASITKIPAKYFWLDDGGSANEKVWTMNKRSELFYALLEAKCDKIDDFINDIYKYIIEIVLNKKDVEFDIIRGELKESDIIDKAPVYIELVASNIISKDTAYNNIFWWDYENEKQKIADENNIQSDLNNFITDNTSNG